MPLPLSTPIIAVHTAPKVISTFFTHFSQAHSRHRAAKKKAKAKAALASESGDQGIQGSIYEGKNGDGDEWETPEKELSYREGLQIVKTFLKTAKSHTVEELQAFTAMHVPYPSWIHLTHVTIPDPSILRAADIITSHFNTHYGPTGLADIGGGEWWKVRGRSLEGEWIEMKRDFLRRTTLKVSEVIEEDSELKADGGAQRAKEKGDRVILYVHGGAYFFSSLDTHRYQIQRHARKLGGRAFAPSYRLAPQYPFPCGLHDVLASYLFLINPPPGSSQAAIPASSIVFSGDSAGAALLLSLLVVIRDSGGTVPMPAGACLISPWVDLTHSMKSVTGPSEGDYIPSEGFHYAPSAGWPPIKGESIEVTMKDKDGKDYQRVLDDQVQLYTSNNLLTHPLVSPINQGSLGGLCPLMIMGGSSELLRDEMTFVAHKAAHPQRYSPSSRILQKYPVQAALVDAFPPTKVHLQMYDGCAHVTPTLSFTKPAKWMYRAAANFNIWALTTAGIIEERGGVKSHHHQQHPSRKSTKTSPSDSPPTTRSNTNSLPDSPAMSSKPSSSFTPATTVSPTASFSDLNKEGDEGPTIAPSISDTVHDLANNLDAVSDAGSEDSSDSDYDSDNPPFPESELVTVTGTEKKFVNSMIRERVSIRGRIRPFEPVEQCDTFVGLDLEQVGSVHGDGPIVGWLKAREEWDTKFSKSLAKHRSTKIADRALASKSGYLTGALINDTPPLCSLASFHDQEAARLYGKSVDEVGRRGKSVSGLLGVWMKAGQKEEETRSSSDEIRKMEQQLEDVGISKDAQRVIGDKNEASVVKHLVKEGVEVKEEVDPGLGVEEVTRKSFEEQVDKEVEAGTASRRKSVNVVGALVGKRD